ncbi:MAG: M50 family metallopeptidase [Ardenticatenaceae bacterium]|nr:M50 family metallopeptidase [Ardenticatenaceae bacterium]MCB9446511.1 M50 family metallopeptidase [Ardenticatenaceae bacterium]
MSNILGLFNIFSLIYIFRSLQLSVTIGREWSSVMQEPLTRRKKYFAEQASFFIAVPLGVFLHEFGHSLAVWASGGQVAEFGYRVFWGYVVPQGTFTPAQDWFISLAGTIGSLVFGVGIWLLLKGNRHSTLSYFGLRALRFQVYFSTIYYPVFTLLGFEGDWRTIYDFGATPLLSGLLVPLHVGLVLLFWWGDRTGWFERTSHETMAEQDKFQGRAQAAALNPQNTQLQLQYVDAMRQGGADNRAKTYLKSFLKQNPDSGSAYLELALLESGSKPQISRRSADYVQKALQMGLPTAAGQSYAHQLLGKYYLDRNEPEQALNEMNAALNLKLEGEEAGVVRHKSALHHLRSQVYRRQKQYELAFQDIQEAIILAQQLGDDKLVVYYRQERDIIENHAGRKLGGV